MPRRTTATSVAWTGLTLLLFIGITASILRATHLGTLYRETNPIRDDVLLVFGVIEPNAARRTDMGAQIDRKYATHAMATLVHVGSGVLLFLLLPMQFSKYIRSRFRAVHRWSGRLIVVVASIAALGGLYFGVLLPFGGTFERMIVGLIGAWFLISLSIAYVSIRRRQVPKHREWMLRAVAGALGISMQRALVLPVDVMLTARGVTPEVVLLHSFWIGWCLTVLTAEWWIRRTRPEPRAAFETPIGELASP